MQTANNHECHKIAHLREGDCEVITQVLPRCYRCGTFGSVNDLFCPTCGAHYAEGTSIWSKRASHDALYCSRCGVRHTHRGDNSEYG